MGVFGMVALFFANTPDVNRDFWKNKIQGNIMRDERVNKELAETGWKVLRFWEHEIFNNLSEVINVIIDNLAI